MGGFKLGKMTLSSIFKKPETYQYPQEQRAMPPAAKGIVAIQVSDCILCGMCAKNCPADAIVVDRKARTWAIDRFRCVQCTSCTHACPKDCLSMEPTRPPVATSKSADVFDIPEQPKPAKE